MEGLIFGILLYLGKGFYLTRGVWYGDFRFNIRIFTCMEDVGMSYPFLNGAVSESEWGGGGGWCCRNLASHSGGFKKWIT